MPAPFATGAAALKWKQSGNNLIKDPGNGGTIPLNHDDGLCELTLAAAGETRVLPPVASIGGAATVMNGCGAKVTVVVNQITGGGTCTINGVTFSSEGDKATFQLMMVDGTKVWANSGNTLLSAENLTLNSTNEFNLAFGGVSALAIDDAAIVGNTAASNGFGKDAFIETQDGGADASMVGGLRGGNFTLTAGVGGAAGAGSGGDGGASGALSLVVQAGGALDGVGATGVEGVIRLIGAIFRKQTVTTKTTTATLTAAEVLAGLLSTTGTSYTVTLPTATLLDNGMHSEVGANEAFDLDVVNTASGTVTIAVGTGSYTVLGLLTFATNVSGQLRFVRTAANTFTVYRTR